MSASMARSVCWHTCNMRAWLAVCASLTLRHVRPHVHMPVNMHAHARKRMLMCQAISMLLSRDLARPVAPVRSLCVCLDRSHSIPLDIYHLSLKPSVAHPLYVCLSLSLSLSPSISLSLSHWSLSYFEPWLSLTLDIYIVPFASRPNLPRSLHFSVCLSIHAIGRP